jgi:hypothetical protein
MSEPIFKVRQRPFLVLLPQKKFQKNAIKLIRPFPLRPMTTISDHVQA